MTDWTLDVTRLDVAPDQSVQAEPGYEDQDPVTSHGFPESLTPAEVTELAAFRTVPVHDGLDAEHRAYVLGWNRAITTARTLAKDKPEQEAADRAVAALTPLVEAAVAWRHGDYEALDGRTANQLADAVDAYRAATPEPQPPAEVSGTPCEPEGGR